VPSGWHRPSRGVFEAFKRHNSSQAATDQRTAASSGTGQAATALRVVRRLLEHAPQNHSGVVVVEPPCITCQVVALPWWSDGMQYFLSMLVVTVCEAARVPQRAGEEWRAPTRFWWEPRPALIRERPALRVWLRVSTLDCGAAWASSHTRTHARTLLCARATKRNRMSHLPLIKELMAVPPLRVWRLRNCGQRQGSHMIPHDEQQGVLDPI
jgi:hypothetical protein